MPAKTKVKPIDAAITEWISTMKFEPIDPDLTEQDFRDFCRLSLRIFSSCMESLFGVSTVDAITFVHVGTYYCISHKMHVSGSWDTLALKFGITSDSHRLQPEEYQNLISLQTDILKRFLSFCWSREHISDQYLSWPWRPEELEAAARMKDAYLFPNARTS